MSEEALDDYLTEKEVGQYLKISRSTLYRHRKAGTFRFIKFGRSIRYRKKDVVEAMRKCVIQLSISCP